MIDTGDVIAVVFAIWQMVIGVALVAALVVFLVVFFLTQWTSPSHEDFLREQRRQEVIQTLTDEQREALGL